MWSLPMVRFAVSSWSLDGLLRSGVPLLELPAQLRQHGVTAFELCHFHLPSAEPAYLQALRERLAAAGVQLFSLLIDAGDIAAPDEGRRAADLAFTREWIAHAAALGAERVRIDAGQQEPTAAVIERSAAGLHALAQHAAALGLAVSTENWRATSREPEALLAILERCPSPLGLCVDTGNAEATGDKYETLARLLPRATSVHFKARYTPAGAIDRDDLRRCLALMEAAAFDGVVTLIYDRKQEEWGGIQALRAALSEGARNASTAT
jgi:sugar phosphate isomerase/epimerase